MFRLLFRRRIIISRRIRISISDVCSITSGRFRLELFIDSDQSMYDDNSGYDHDGERNVRVQELIDPNIHSGVKVIVDGRTLLARVAV
jgi:hypothetical protein